jgi:glycosyltransferase involved in cell wall biosynthesis
MSLHSLMFGWEYPPRHLGGLGVACQGLVRGLLRHGVQITLVLPFPLTDPAESVEVRFPTDESVRRIPVPTTLSPYDSPHTYARRLDALPRELSHLYGDDLAHAVHVFTETSVETTRDLAPDVVHCHDWMTYEAGIRSARHHDRPLVAHIHATELDRTHFHPNEWIYERERTGFRAADRIIAVSRYTKSILTDHYGVAPERISVVHNATDHLPHPPAPQPPAAPRARGPMVLFLGRLAIQKGARHFLDMAAQIHTMRPDVQFVLAGDGDLLPSLMHEAAHLGLSDAVAFAGKVSQQEARSLFAQADCFVMPSLSEPFGLVALEAIAHGTPVVLSKQSGASEVIAHSFTVDFWDTEKMADCVLTILREHPLARQLKSEAPRVLQHLTWLSQAGLVRSIYEDVLRN